MRLLPRDPVRCRPDARLAQGPARFPVRRPRRLPADGATFVADAVRRGAAAILAASDAVLPPLDQAIVVVRDANPRRRMALMAADLRRPAARHHRRRHRHQRQVSTVHFVRHIWAGARPQGGERRHARHRLAGPHARRRPDHARSGAAPRRSGDPGARGRDASCDRGVEPWPRPASSRRARALGRLLHQPDARASRLSRLDGRLLRRQGAAVREPAAAKRHRRRERRQRSRRRSSPTICAAPRRPLLDLRRKGPRVPAAAGRADAGRPASRGRGAGPASRDRAAAGRRLPGLQCAGRARPRRRDRRRSGARRRGPGDAERRAWPAAARRPSPHRRARLCRLRPQARGAGDGARRPCGRSPTASWSWCSAAAAIATAPSGR